MTTEIVVGLLAAGALGAVGYTVQRHRERVKWAKVREEQLGELEQLKRLGWYKKKSMVLK